MSDNELMNDDKKDNNKLNELLERMGKSELINNELDIKKEYDKITLNFIDFLFTYNQTFEYCDSPTSEKESYYSESKDTLLQAYDLYEKKQYDLARSLAYEDYNNPFYNIILAMIELAEINFDAVYDKIIIALNNKCTQALEILYHIKLRHIEYPESFDDCKEVFNEYVMKRLKTDLFEFLNNNLEFVDKYVTELENDNTVVIKLLLEYIRFTKG